MNSLLLNLITKMLQKLSKILKPLELCCLLIMKGHEGASPDIISTCICCTKGVVKVKCPFCVKDCLPQEGLDNFCMTQKNG